LLGDVEQHGKRHQGGDAELRERDVEDLTAEEPERSDRTNRQVDDEDPAPGDVGGEYATEQWTGDQRTGRDATGCASAAISEPPAPEVRCDPAA
jgi:hypothetical protein